MIMTFKVITIKRDTYIIIMIMIMTFIPVIIMIKRSVYTIANTHHAQECEDEGSGEENPDKVAEHYQEGVQDKVVIVSANKIEIGNIFCMYLDSVS